MIALQQIDLHGLEVEMKKALFYCLLLVLLLFVSCNQNVETTKPQEPQHTHSFKVAEDGHLWCSGCEKAVYDDYIAYMNQGEVESYGLLYGSNASDSGLLVNGMEVTYTPPPRRQYK